MNVYDSERMSEALGEDGYEETLNPSEADMILLNTCHIREKAAEKERLDKLRVNNENYPLPGSSGQFDKFKVGNNSDSQNGSFQSANSSPVKEQTENR